MLRTYITQMVAPILMTIILVTIQVIGTTFIQTQLRYKFKNEFI
jgi:hypothetical protein